MATKIQISRHLLKKLKGRKIFEDDSYEDVIWDSLEEKMELSEKTERHIEQARKEIAEGKFHTFEHVKKKLGL